jgi:hypothetical protein
VGHPYKGFPYRKCKHCPTLYDMTNLNDCVLEGGLGLDCALIFHAYRVPSVHFHSLLLSLGFFNGHGYLLEESTRNPCSLSHAMVHGFSLSVLAHLHIFLAILKHAFRQSVVHCFLWELGALFDIPHIPSIMDL